MQSNPYNPLCFNVIFKDRKHSFVLQKWRKYSKSNQILQQTFDIKVFKIQFFFQVGALNEELVLNDEYEDEVAIQ